MKYKRNGIEISRIGLGCGRMTGPNANKKECVKTIHTAMEFGPTLINTAFWS